MTQSVAEPTYKAATADLVGHRYLVCFEKDTLRHRLWLPVIVEFLGTFVVVTIAAGAGVIKHYVGTDPISRAAAVITTPVRS